MQFHCLFHIQQPLALTRTRVNEYRAYLVWDKLTGIIIDNPQLQSFKIELQKHLLRLIIDYRKTNI